MDEDTVTMSVQCNDVIIFIIYSFPEIWDVNLGNENDWERYLKRRENLEG